MVTKHTKAGATHTQAGGKSSTRSKASASGNGHSAPGEHRTEEIKEGIIDTLSGLSTIESDIAALARRSIVDALRTGGGGADELVKVVHHVMIGAIDAAEEVGSGLTMSTRSVAKGIIMGVHDVGGDMVTASFEIMRAVIMRSSTIGADIGMVAKHAVDGVIEATAETGGNIDQIGKKAIESAIEEAGHVSNIAMKTVRDVLIGIAGSLSETIGASLPQGLAGTQSRHSARSAHHS